jgi:hypothetical protein
MDFRTEFSSYPKGETVIFSLSLRMPPPVKLPRRRPYRILRGDTPIYTPSSDYPHTEIVSPGRPAQWRWHQRDDQERQVSQGEYAVLLYPEDTDTCQANFRILNSGSEPSKGRAMKRGERSMWAGNSLLAFGTAFFDPVTILLGLSLGIYGIRNKEYATDPPDSEFRKPVRLSERTFRLEPARTPVVEAAQEFAVSAIRCADLVDAVRISLERIQAALDKDANDSARARLTDFRRFASFSIMADLELAQRSSQLEHYLIEIKPEYGRLFASDGSIRSDQLYPFARMLGLSEQETNVISEKIKTEDRWIHHDIRSHAQLFCTELRSVIVSGAYSMSCMLSEAADADAAALKSALMSPRIRPLDKHGILLQRLETHKIRIPDPPGPDDTAKELESLLDMQNNQVEREQRRKRIEEEDDDPALQMRRVLVLHPSGERAYTFRLLQLMLYVGRSVADHYKMMFRRPRPVQLEPRLRPMIDVPETFSYPGEHAVSIFLAAMALGRVVHDLRLANELSLIARDVATNREWAGVNYPSDKVEGEKLASEILPEILDVFGEDFSNATREWWDGLAPLTSLGRRARSPIRRP